MKLYPVIDYIDNQELANVGGNPAFPILDIMQQKRNIRAVYIGETRPPKKGEWFLSGAIVEAYRALNDLTSAYPIARLVMTKTTTTTKTEIV